MLASWIVTSNLIWQTLELINNESLKHRQLQKRIPVGKMTKKHMRELPFSIELTIWQPSEHVELLYVYNQKHISHCVQIFSILFSLFPLAYREIEIVSIFHTVPNNHTNTQQSSSVMNQHSIKPSPQLTQLQQQQQQQWLIQLFVFVCTQRLLDWSPTQCSALLTGWKFFFVIWIAKRRK